MGKMDVRKKLLFLLSSIVLAASALDNHSRDKNNGNDDDGFALRDGVVRVNKPRVDVSQLVKISTDSNIADLLDEDFNNPMGSLRAHNNLLQESNRRQQPTSSVRCFCNLPVCVSTGYMCKSSNIGGCFSDLKQHHHSSQQLQQAVYFGKHGCLELLTEKEQKEWCQIYPTASTNTNNNNYNNQHPSRRKSSQQQHPKSLLYCCYQDMCNHADDPHTKDLINDTTLGELFQDRTAIEQQEAFNNSEVWFKAATIAVPIFGIVILLVLIILAIKLLKPEESFNASDYKIGPPYSSPESKHHPDTFGGSQRLFVPVHQAGPQQVYTNQIPRYHRSPIVVHKDTNVKNAMNYSFKEYNLIPQDPKFMEIYKHYRNKDDYSLEGNKNDRLNLEEKHCLVEEKHLLQKQQNLPKKSNVINYD